MDIRECQDLIFSWFWNWDALVNSNNEESQKMYNLFIENNFDSEWNLTVHGGDKLKGEQWVDSHKKDKDYIEFQQDMAKNFVSSYSIISPLQFIEYKYDVITGNEYALFRGTSIGNMGVINKKSKKNKMMTTHQSMELQFIKRPNQQKWKLYKEDSNVTVLDFADAV